MSDEMTSKLADADMPAAAKALLPSDQLARSIARRAQRPLGLTREARVAR